MVIEQNVDIIISLQGDEESPFGRNEEARNYADHRLEWPGKSQLHVSPLTLFSTLQDRAGPRYDRQFVTREWLESPQQSIESFHPLPVLNLVLLRIVHCIVSECKAALEEAIKRIVLEGLRYSLYRSQCPLS